jgi:hypothetical protein
VELAEPSRLAYEVQTVGWERILEICTYQGLLEALFENLSATVPSDAFDAWVRIPTLLVLMGRTDEAFEFIQGPESSKQRPRTVTELEAALQAYVDQVPKSAE